MFHPAFLSTTMEALAGVSTSAGSGLFGPPTTAPGSHRHRPSRHRRADRAGRREDTARPTRRLGENPQVAGRVRRADAILNAGRAYLQRDDATLEHIAAGEYTTLDNGALPAGRGPRRPDSAFARRWICVPQGGSTS